MTRARGFWSDRKAAVAAEEQAAVQQQAELTQQEREAAMAEMSDAELLDALELPDPDDMNADDDFKQFLTEAVPARLKTRALRRLWRVNPIFGQLDGLVDYGEDFTDSATVVENMQSAYQVGKGMLKHVEEMARKAAEAAEAPDESEIPEAAQELTEEEVLAEVDEVEEPEARPEPVEPLATADEDTLIAAPRRRMQFTFEDSATT